MVQRKAKYTRLSVTIIIVSAFSLASCGVSQAVKDENNIQKLEEELDRQEAEMQSEE